MHLGIEESVSHRNELPVWLLQGYSICNHNDVAQSASGMERLLFVICFSLKDDLWEHSLVCPILSQTAFVLRYSYVFPRDSSCPNPAQ